MQSDEYEPTTLSIYIFNSNVGNIKTMNTNLRYIFKNQDHLNSGKHFAAAIHHQLALHYKIANALVFSPIN
jgi:hypothetical protein